MDHHANVTAYTDISRFNAMRASARGDGEAAFSQVIKEFEALFIELMLSTARDASFEGGLFDNQELKMYQEMFDSQVALAMSERSGLGFEKAMRSQLGMPEDSTVSAGELSLPSQKSIAPIQTTSGALDRSVDTKNRLSRSQTLTATPSTSTKSIDAANKESSESDKQLAFVSKLYPHAKAAADALNTTPQILLAQAALETGWGQHMITRGNSTPSHNYFGIKATPSWTGKTASVSTVEFINTKPIRVKAAFRAYGSIEESFQDYVNLVKQNARYQPALSSGGDPDQYIRALSKAGYATDPNYASKVSAINERMHHLTSIATSNVDSVDASSEALK